MVSSISWHHYLIGHKETAPWHVADRICRSDHGLRTPSSRELSSNTETNSVSLCGSSYKTYNIHTCTCLHVCMCTL